MCGIAGIITRRVNVSFADSICKMTNAIRHRGPDGEGFWNNADHTVTFGHRRLSIIDISDNGAQPMHYMQRYTLIYNGEIYNYIEIKESLVKEGYTFSSQCDSEVILALYAKKKQRCVDDLDGMFAFAIYDAVENTVFMARDRFGEKPFFYYKDQDENFFFASEIKALWSVGAPKDLDEQFVFNYLSFGHAQNPDDPKQTFYKNIFKLPPAHFLSYHVATASVRLEKYWDIDLTYTNAGISESHASGKLQDLLSSSVARRLRSDVPVGSSLSGGLDSSIIVTLMDKLHANNAFRRKTFSASFPGFAKDETKYQQIVISDTSVEPHFVYPDEASFFENFEQICYHQDEPFGSASINIQYEVFRKAKEEGVTVLLDGQGADEVFAGYHGYYYSFFDELRRKGNGRLKKEYESYRSLHADNAINQEIQISKISSLKRLLPATLKDAGRNYFVKLPAAKKLLSKDFFDCHKHSIFRTKEAFPDLNSSLYYSVFNMGLEELLRYADRNSMAHSREVRLPFLNHDLVSFVFSLPSHYKIKDGWTKWLLRSAFQEQLDHRIVWRKDKIGYEPPQKKWLSHPAFRTIVEDSLQRLQNNRVIDRHLTTDMVASNPLFMWRLVMISNASV